jgi:hypothetical protein
MNDLQEKLNQKLNVNKGITIDEIRSIVQGEIKTIIEHLNKLTLIVSTIDNKVSKLASPVTVNTPTNTVNTNTPTSTKYNLEVLGNDKLMIPDNVQTMISDMATFRKITDIVYHQKMNFKTFKSSWYDKAKEMNISIKKVVSSVKSKDIWEALEKGWNTSASTSKDVTNQITLKETLIEAGIKIEKLNKVVELFSDIVESSMFTNRTLNHNAWKVVAKELNIDFSKLNANMESKVRLFMSEALYNNLGK